MENQEFAAGTDPHSFSSTEFNPLAAKNRNGNAGQQQDDVFTFVRIQFDSGGFRRRGPSWNNDFPDSDWNFSSRLQELTSLEVDPDGLVIRLTDEELFDFPFIFMSNVQNLSLSPQEAERLGRYLLRGGFLLADDFWTRSAWTHVQQEMKRLFPNSEPVELTMDHPIFHIVYEIQGTPQVPSIFAWRQGDTFPLGINIITYVMTHC